jgi:hypothetical protein
MRQEPIRFFASPEDREMIEIVPQRDEHIVDVREATGADRAQWHDINRAYKRSEMPSGLGPW